MQLHVQKLIESSIFDISDLYGLNPSSAWLTRNVCGCYKVFVFNEEFILIKKKAVSFCNAFKFCM